MHPARPADKLPAPDVSHWQAELTRGFRNSADLLSALGLTAPGFVAGPVGDLASARAPGLLQKYADQSATAGQLEEALRVIGSDRSLQEIIVSGGDPLVLAESRLESLLRALDDLPHVLSRH